MPTIANAESMFLPDRNPFTGTYQNQMSYGIGQGFDTGILLPPPVKPVPFYIGTMTYSQPTTFFRIPARRNLNISMTLGYLNLKSHLVSTLHVNGRPRFSYNIFQTRILPNKIIPMHFMELV